MSHDRTRARRTRVQAAAALAGLLAFTFLAGAASLGRIRPAHAPQQPTAVTVRQDDTTTAYHAGWRAGVAALGDNARPTYPNVIVSPHYDGQAHTLATNHTDITLHEHESAPHAPHIGNCVRGPQRDASHTSR